MADINSAIKHIEGSLKSEDNGMCYILQSRLWHIRHLLKKQQEEIKHLQAENDRLKAEQPKKGHWIDIDSQLYTWKVRCNQCGHERSMISTQGKYPRFCEGCGTDMRGEDGMIVVLPPERLDGEQE